MNFYSEEWIEMKGWLKEMLDNELRSLETATDEKNADKARGALRVIRLLLAKESKRQTGGA